MVDSKENYKFDLGVKGLNHFKCNCLKLDSYKEKTQSNFELSAWDVGRCHKITNHNALV